MTGNSAHSKRGRIMHKPAKYLATCSIVTFEACAQVAVLSANILGRGRSQRRRQVRGEDGTKHRYSHARRQEILFFCKVGQILTTYTMHDLTQNNEPNIRINKSRPRRVAEFFFFQSGEHTFAARPFFAEVEIGAVAGGVREKLLDGDLLRFGVFALGNEFADGVTQPKLPLLDEDHYRGRRRNRLGQRRYVKDRIDRHLLPLWAHE